MEFVAPAKPASSQATNLANQLFNPWLIIIPTVKPPVPLLEFLARAHVKVAATMMLGTTTFGERRIVPILGGRFEGRVNAEVLPGGADWQVVGRQGTIYLEARYTLQNRRWRPDLCPQPRGFDAVLPKCWPGCSKETPRIHRNITFERHPHSKPATPDMNG